MTFSVQVVMIVSSRPAIEVFSFNATPLKGTCKSSLPSFALWVGDRVKRARVLAATEVPVPSLPLMLVLRKDCLRPALS